MSSQPTLCCEVWPIYLYQTGFYLSGTCIARLSWVSLYQVVLVVVVSLVILNIT